eukprot:TRINITY_DN3066_c0_g1_i9.p1 TRINITY_DN3066_c0_g1~~TRINITY_DN3066_c0_g1_i9.p1  ORF type:complete len:672 (+),score=131.78 TRINITY_DN3066_c0_g1_i9:417-2432(+)
MPVFSSDISTARTRSSDTSDTDTDSSEEEQGQLLRAQNETGFKGVGVTYRGKYRARYAGVRLGTFASAEEAAAVYAAYAAETEAPTTSSDRRSTHNAKEESEGETEEQQRQPQGQLIRANNLSGFKGVSLTHGKYRARYAGVRLGNFDTAEEAAAVYAAYAAETEAPTTSSDRRSTHNAKEESEGEKAPAKAVVARSKARRKRKPFQAWISIESRDLDLGRFYTKEEAANAYTKAKKVLPLNDYEAARALVAQQRAEDETAPENSSEQEEDEDQAIRAKNLTGFKGVSPAWGKFRARHRGIRLGTFDTPQEAAAVYAVHKAQSKAPTKKNHEWEGPAKRQRRVPDTDDDCDHQQPELIRADNQSGFKGVSLTHGKYRARYAGIPLGHFDTAEEAALAYAAEMQARTRSSDTSDTDTDSSEEEQGQLLRAQNETGFKGVGVTYRGKYRARYAGVRLGTFASAEEAAAVYTAHRVEVEARTRSDHTDREAAPEDDQLIRASNRTGFRGVSMSKRGKFKARYRGVWLGQFPTAEQAAAAYAAHKLETEETNSAAKAGPALDLVRSSCASGFKGVELLPEMNRFRARIIIQATKLHLGCFKTAEEAADAYAAAKAVLPMDDYEAAHQIVAQQRAHREQHEEEAAAAVVSHTGASTNGKAVAISNPSWYGGIGLLI